MSIENKQKQVESTLRLAPVVPVVIIEDASKAVGMARALGNLIGNCVATVVIAAWEGDLDYAKAEQVLNGNEVVDVTAG